MNKLKRTEHGEQEAVFEWAKVNERKYPELKLLFAIPNGFYVRGASKLQRIISAKYMKAEGMKSGVPDIFLAVPSLDDQGEDLSRVLECGLFIEMKLKGSYPSEEQKKFMDLLYDQEYRVELCRSADEAIKVIKDYLDI